MNEYTIPTLRTERLQLRPMTMQDWPEYLSFLSSQRAQFMGGPFDEHDAWSMFTHDMAQWPLMNHGALMIELNETSQTIGQVGLNHGPLFPEHELGWLLFQGYEGNGYALEAASALKNWAFNELGLKTLVSYIHKDNLQSKSLAQKLGALPDPQAQKHAQEDEVFRYTSE